MGKYAMKEGQDIFDYRYLQRNARISCKNARLDDKLSEWLFKQYYKVRFKMGKLDIPQFDLVLTTRCSLNCKDCNNLMQYYDSSPDCHINPSFAIVKDQLYKFLDNVDSVGLIYVLGGEPFMFKEIHRVITMLELESKVKSYVVVTNGTIMPSLKFYEAISNSKKGSVEISDYSRNPDLVPKLKQTEIIEASKKHNFKAEIRKWPWYNIGGKYRRFRTKDENKENFRACALPCCQLVPGLGYFVCPVSAGVAGLTSKRNILGDYLQLNRSLTRSDIIDFYKKDYFKSCDYCPKMSDDKYEIPVAIQTKELYSLD